ncbi:glutamyl-tRNA(Gln) amidotransferase subunit D [Patulibacter medicamentivorans]|uniref:Glutamyl-tRNA(Gln) amidotransferase subunit D n=1 Tax=Patulibacter medicamentivorans TaxID=1097667 RepID=H0EBB0_9ACTN|nr:asparaginase domain-containing protein [Patulibacter medicamentivorans]EHN08986.1 glutamyl-tRNA(Gln) amidotransferase subunit D [Patulibacter medicamentivorans]
MARNRLGLVLTGGTIGSTSSDDAEVVRLVRGNDAGGMPGWLAGPLAAFGSHQLTVRRPVELHSEEARPEHWEAIATACRRLAERGAEAICVLHGSDTMSYTAAALSFALADLSIPVVLTGSNLPPDDPESDARNNVRQAIIALRTLPAGVYLIFAGSPDGDALVHLGTRVRKDRASGEAFVSPNGGPVAKVVGGRLMRLAPWPLPVPPPAMPTVARFDPRVLELRVHPGMPFAALEAAVRAGGLRGVVAELYPCATGPTGEDDASLERFARFVTARGGIVAATVAAAPEVAGSYYPSLPTLTGAGVGFLPGVLSATATVKLMWALAAADGDPAVARSLMRRPIAGESAPMGRRHPPATRYVPSTAAIARSAGH